MVHRGLPPCFGADRRRWQVATRRVVARKAERHRQDCHASPVIECVVCDPHPIAQPAARKVSKRAPADLHACAGRLARNEDAGTAIKPHHRARRVGGRRRSKAISAQGTGINVQKKCHVLIFCQCQGDTRGANGFDGLGRPKRYLCGFGKR